MRCTALQSSVPSDMVAGVSVRGDTWCVLPLNNKPPVQASCRPHATVQSHPYYGECIGMMDRACTIAPQLRSQCPRGAGSGNETWSICIAERLQYMLAPVGSIGLVIFGLSNIHILADWQDVYTLVPDVVCVNDC